MILLVKDAEQKLKTIVSTYLDDDMQELKFLLQPLSGIHLGGNVNFGEGVQSDIRQLFLVSSIGLFIILIAIFNYMNMASARAFSIP
jgi:putative ABC transport system permease protein